jgi:hypothetical protein
METTVNSEPLEKQEDATKIESILSKSIKVGNFGNEFDSINENKDIYKIGLDGIKDYVQYLPFLPDGFGFTGGTARSALLGILGETIPKIRDFDIEGVNGIPGEADPNPKDAIAVANQYLRDDYISSTHVRSSLNKYFKERDFTINEVFLIGNDLYFSRGALNDAANKIVRPTDFEKNSVYKNYDEYNDEYVTQTGKIPPKLLLRALLFQVELFKLYGHSETKEIESYEMRLNYLPPFYLAKSIQKASQKGVAIEFYKQLFDTIINNAEVVNNPTKKGLVTLAKLTKHWMVDQGDDRVHDFNKGYFSPDHDEINNTNDNDYFLSKYDESWKESDDAKFNEWYQKSISRTVHFSKTEPQDLDY